MAPQRRGVYVMSADVSFLLANKASLQKGIGAPSKESQDPLPSHPLIHQLYHFPLPRRSSSIFVYLSRVGTRRYQRCEIALLKVRRCQRERHHRVGRFDHTNYRDSSDAIRSSLSLLRSWFLSVSRFELVQEFVRHPLMNDQQGESMCISTRASHPMLNCSSEI